MKIDSLEDQRTINYQQANSSSIRVDDSHLINEIESGAG